jgi:hypothetical protein
VSIQTSCYALQNAPILFFSVSSLPNLFLANPLRLVKRLLADMIGRNPLWHLILNIAGTGHDAEPLPAGKFRAFESHSCQTRVISRRFQPV